MMKRYIYILALFIACPVFGQVSTIPFDPKTSTRAVVSADCEVSYSSWAIKSTMYGKDLTIYRPYKTYKQYTKQIDKENFEIGLTFSVKPSTNIFEFQVDGYGNFDFVKQVGGLGIGGKPILFDPVNAEGGYAIFQKSNGEIGKGGKVAMVYRPKLIDNNLNESWCDMNIVNGKITVNCDNAWLKTAAYPVILDPNLGVTSIGSAYDNNGLWLVSYRLGFMTENGTLTTIKTCAWKEYSLTDPTSCWIKAVVSADNGSGYPGALVAGSYTGQVNITQYPKPTQDSEWTSATVTGTLTQGVTYWITHMYNSTSSGLHTCYAYDTAPATFRVDADFTPSFHWTDWSTTAPDPAPVGMSVYDGYNRSMYIVYTAGGGGGGTLPASRKRKGQILGNE